MLVLLNFLTFAILCIAQVIPTAPGPGETFREGSDCTVKWKPDTTGTWDSFDIDLMSGSNDNMTYVIHVVSQLGGTSSSYSWTCPKVQPYSAIYFYQFNQKHASTNASHAWTTRFTIASETGETTSPEHSKQPSGDPIPWGMGKLIVAGEEHSRTHTGTSRHSSQTPASAEEVSSTPRHVITFGPETTAAADVTLNVPAPNPTRKSRRNVFKTVYKNGKHSELFSSRPTNVVCCL